MKTINTNEDFTARSSKQAQQLRKEIRQRISQTELEALDHIFALSQSDPATFHGLWIQPLSAEGLSFEAIIAHIVDSYLWPN